MSVLPGDTYYGKAVGQFLLATPDASDPGDLPDALPMEGVVKISPIVRVFRNPDPNAPLVAPTAVLCTLDEDGNLRDPEGNLGVWLVEGEYKVRYLLTNARLRTHRLTVTRDNDEDHPVNLRNFLPPLGPVAVPGEYAELSARIDALGEPGVAADDPRLSDARTPLPHNHDDVYYTDDEVDALIENESENRATAIATEAATRLSEDTALDIRVTTLEEDPGPDLTPYATDSDLSSGLATKAAVSHTHVSASIADFREAVEDAVAGMLVGAGISIEHDDASDTITLTGVSGENAESIRDIIGSALVGVGPISIVPNDSGDTIVITVSATVNSTDAALRDRSTHTGEQPISSVTGLQLALDGKAADGHNHDDRYMTDAEVAAAIAAGGSGGEAEAGTMVHRGLWSAGTYPKGSVVVRDGITYVATIESPSVGPNPLAPPFNDNFQRSDSSTVGWTVEAAEYSIFSGKLTAAALGGQRILQECSNMNGLFEVVGFDNTGDNNANAGIVLRFVDNNNFLRFQRIMNTFNMALFSVVGGTATQIGAAIAVGSTPIDIDVFLRGTTAEITISGTTHSRTVPTPSADATKFGFHTNLINYANALSVDEVTFTPYNDTGWDILEGGSADHDHEQSDIVGLSEALADKATLAQGAKADTALQPSLVDGKGELIAGTGDNAVARVPAGTTNGHVLMVESSAATGMVWGAPPSGGGGGTSGVLLIDYGASVPPSTPVGTIIFEKSSGIIEWDFKLGALPAGWTKRGTAPTETFSGAGMQATFGGSARGYVCPLTLPPLGADWTFEIEVVSANTFGAMFGPMVTTPSGAGAGATWYTSPNTLLGVNVSGFAYSSGFVQAVGAPSHPSRLRLRRSGTTNYVGYSTNGGTSWTEAASNVGAASTGEVLSIGCMNNSIIATIASAKFTPGGTIAGSRAKGWWDGSTIQPLAQ